MTKDNEINILSDDDEIEHKGDNKPKNTRLDQIWIALIWLLLVTVSGKTMDIMEFRAKFGGALSKT